MIFLEEIREHWRPGVRIDRECESGEHDDHSPLEIRLRSDTGEPPLGCAEGSWLPGGHRERGRGALNAPMRHPDQASHILQPIDVYIILPAALALAVRHKIQDPKASRQKGRREKTKTPKKYKTQRKSGPKDVPMTYPNASVNNEAKW